MLKDFDFKALPTTYQDSKIKDLGEQLSNLQRKVQALKIPVLILIDGWESSGKGHVLKNLTRELDPRYVRVEVFEDPTDAEEAHPTAWRYWQRIPSREEMAVYDRSFYHAVMNNLKLDKEDTNQKIEELKAFETMLIKDGYLVLKFFLNISQDSQKDRIKELEKSAHRQYLLSDLDYDQNKSYKDYQKHFNKILKQTHSQDCPWRIINAEDKDLASLEILGQTIEIIETGIEANQARRADTKAQYRDFRLEEAIIPSLDLSQSMSEEEYDQMKDELQEEAAQLVYECYQKEIPIVVAFEGIDAAGKGGAIQRLTRQIDPRSYKIYGIKAPTEDELNHHYLWRFQTKFPQDGQMRIFDRSWYGRVLVERIEGFAMEKEWERAYDEINTMEKVLTDHGTIVMKFFLYIDKDEQAERFKDREENPDKNYKITAEDWRNRDKWEAYDEAFEEMLARTHTENAPWYVVGSNQKYFARIQVLKHFINHIKKHLKAIKEDK